MFKTLFGGDIENLTFYNSSMHIRYLLFRLNLVFFFTYHNIISHLTCTVIVDKTLHSMGIFLLNAVIGVFTDLFIQNTSRLQNIKLRRFIICIIT